MDLCEGPSSPQSGLPPRLPNVVRFVTDRFHECQEHVGKVLQSWNNPAGGHDVLESLTGFKAALPHRKRRRRKDARFASLSMGLQAGRGQPGPHNLVFDGLCVASDKKATQGKAQVSFPAPRREEQERILISEVEVQGVEGPLKAEAEAALTLRPNFAYTEKEVKDNMRRIFDIGAFQETRIDAQDTRDGVKVVFKVKVNPEVKGVIVKGANVLPTRVLEDFFRTQTGKPLNYPRMSAAVKGINAWYDDRGYIGQVTKVEENGGIVEVQTAEMQVGNITLQFVDKKSGEVKSEGITRPDIILRQLCTHAGQVYNTKQAKQDIDAVYSMGLFDDVNIKPVPAEGTTVDLPKVDLTLNVVERKMGGLSGGGGISAQNHMDGALPGFIGSVSYSQRNLFGLNQKLTGTVEIGQLDSLFRISHTDPWVVGDLNRTSRSINIQNTRASGNPIHGRAQDDVAPQRSQAVPGEGSQDTNVVVARLMSGVEWGRPLSTGWTGTMGINWQRARCLDDKGRPILQDAYGSPLTFSGSGTDTMMLALLRAVYSKQADSQLIASMEQSLPLRPEWLNFNRFRLRVQKSIPFTKLRLPAVRGILTAKGGMIVGDLPPYEAFPIGGTNSVRGYSEGGVGSGRNYVVGTAEIQFPLQGPLEGTLFADYGHDLESGQTVLGDPAGARGKPGSGYGYGAGIRLDSPVGPLRFEYAFNDHGSRRFHLGIGSHG